MSTPRPLPRNKVTRTTRRKAKAPARVYRVGQATRESIVSAASTVLVKYGYAGLTLKRVAEAADVAVGNLNYHFRTKEDLLQALIDRTLSGYAERFRELVARQCEGGEDALTSLVDWVMGDSASDEYTRLFRELWAMASHNASVAAAMDHFYDQSITAAMHELTRRGDTLSRADLRAIVLLTCLLSEGASVVFGLRKQPRREFDGVRRLAARFIATTADALRDKRR